MAIGDPIYIQLKQAIAGYGAKGDVLAVTESAYIDTMIAAGLVVIVATPGSPGSTNNALGELAYAQNVTGTVTVCPAGGAATLIPGCVIVVPISARPVFLDASIDFQITTAQAGFLAANLYETTSGSPVILKSGVRQVSALAGTGSKFSTVPVQFRLGVTAAVRTFALYGSAFGDSAGLVANALNSASGPSFIGAAAK